MREQPGLQDRVTINGEICQGHALERIAAHLDRIRASVNPSLKAHVQSWNSFPASAGIASSASGFCALTLAAQTALMGESTDQSVLAAARQARLASGSACRSFWGGFVEWEAGHDHDSSVPRPLHAPEHWELFDIVVVLDTRQKKVSSHDGHRLADTSPILASRLAYVADNLPVAKEALRTRELAQLGPIMEADALFMHAVMLTSQPPLLYLDASSVQLMELVLDWRNREGLAVYFTVDAGPNLHLLCEKGDVDEVLARLQQLDMVQDLILNRPGPAPIRLSEEAALEFPPARS